MSVMEPFSIGVVPVLRLLNRRLVERLNCEPNQGALWRAETGQLACSKQGALRVIWRLVGGPIELGPVGAQGDAAKADNIGRRHPVIEAQIRAIDPRTSGLTDEDVNMAELVQRQILWVLRERLSGDVEIKDLHEFWDEYTESPAQNQVMQRLRFGLRVLVPDDPYNLQPYTETTATGVLTASQK